jgi:hypothetical protein
MKLLVLSTFDITPVRDGGQTRYVGLYRRMAEKHDVTVFVYDYRSELPDTRAYMVESRLRVLLPPIAPPDRNLFFTKMHETGLFLHDWLCMRQYQFSAAAKNLLRDEIAKADVVVAAHPYLAPLAFHLCGERQIKVYEAHNVEYDAKRSYFSSKTEAPCSECARTCGIVSGSPRWRRIM